VAPLDTDPDALTAAIPVAQVEDGSVWRLRLSTREGAHVRGHSVEAELVALDVLHHEARLVVAIGRQ
jgi:hypothetical protein